MTEEQLKEVKTIAEEYGEDMQKLGTQYGLINGFLWGAFISGWAVYLVMVW